MILRTRLTIILLICAYLAGLANKQDTFQVGKNSARLKDSIDYYLFESEQLIDSNPLLSSSNASKAQQLAATLNYEEMHAYASRLLGEAKLNIENYYEAENQLITARNFYINTRKELIKADIEHLLGMTRYHLRKYSDAIRNFEHAAKIYNVLDEKQKYAQSLQSIGLVYNNLNDLENAEVYFYKSLALNTEINKDENIASLYQNLGIINYKKENDSLAIEYYKKSIHYFLQKHDLDGIGITYSNIGLVYLRSKNFPEAFKNFKKAQTYFSKTNSQIGQMWALNNMGASKASMGDFEDAEKYFFGSLFIAREIDNIEGILTNLEDLTRYYEETGSLAKSLQYQKLYAHLKDSVTTQEAKNEIAELELLYQLESKEKEKAKAELENERRTTHVYATLSIILIILFAGIVVFTAYFQKTKAERKLAKHKTDLESLVQQRTLELKEQISERKTAEESDKLKSAFLANMSHELRTPMNAIIAFSNFLREPDISSEQKVEYLDHITRAGDTLLTLIDDIIDIAKIESQQLKLFIQPTNINHLLGELYKVFSELRAKNNKNNILFKLNIDTNYNYIINSDVNRLKQVLSNLLDNAFKYTERGQIELGFTNTSNSVTFYVSDTGHGIPKDKHEAIFDRFYQLKHANDRRTTNGTGLGLTICKNLVKLLGGKIWIESEEGKGSKFMIRIPVESIKKQVNSKLKPATKKSKDSIHPKYDWHNLTILVAEDEDLNYKVLSTCLTRTKAHIIRARDGESAVEICKNQKVDIVLMDIQMPGMNGYEATQEIKRLNNRTPVIAQTSFAMTGEKERCLQAGCDDFITKPLNIDELLEKIKNHVLIKVK
jgi:signal transduction histidine kinase